MNIKLVKARVPGNRRKTLQRKHISGAAFDLANMLEECRTEEDAIGPAPGRFKDDKDSWRKGLGPNALRNEEKLMLDKAEFDFALCLDSIRKIGLPLRDIKANQYYRGKYQSFSEYCEKRWGIDEGTAQSLMDLMFIDETRFLGNLLLPCDHPRADDLADAIQLHPHGNINDFRAKTKKRDLLRYKKRQGKYEYPY